MTVQGSAICTLIQGFPVLLILAQNHNRCLETPFVYKPPSPTHSPEYYEALDALFQTLYGHGSPDHGHGHHNHGHDYHGHHDSEHGHGCHGYEMYGKKLKHDYTSQHGHKPCYSGYPAVANPTNGYGYPIYGYGHQGHGQHYPSYGYKKNNGENTGNNHGNKGTYAPNQVYNINHKYKVVIKKNRMGPHKRRSEKLTGFFPNQREDRRYGNQFGFLQNVLPNSDRIRNTVTGILHLRPETPSSNPSFIYPFNNRPGISNDGYYDQYGRPYQNNQNYPNSFPNYNQPVKFPQSYPNQQVQNVNQNPPNQYNADNGFSVNEYQPNFVQEPVKVVETAQPVEFPTFDNIKEEAPSFVDNTGEGITEASKDVNFPEEVNDPEKKPSQGFPAIPPGFVPPTELPPLTPVASEGSSLLGQSTPLPWVPSTGLPELTPVPASESRNNFNFGTQGLFNEACNTVDGGVGSCVVVQQCKHYLDILQKSRSNPGFIQLLRKAHCGFQGDDPKVCCPLQGIPTVPPPPPPTTTTVAPVDVATGKSVDHSDYISALPEPPVCGASNGTLSRVVNGVDAKLGDFPWMALLGYRSRKTQGARWLCGGSLISSKHVLTAAHCINEHENDLFLVRLGELDLAKDDEGATPVDILIKTMIKNEKYDPNAYTNDIGLLVLERDVQFTDLIRPICIPRASELRSNNFENYNPLIAGWGDTEFRGPAATRLQVLQLPVLSNDYCRQAYARYKKQVIDERVLCAGYKNGGKDACQGDSGGPLMQPIATTREFKPYFYQIGVVSFGYKCAEAGFPGIYSRVTEFVPWIEEKVLGSV